MQWIQQYYINADSVMPEDELPAIIIKVSVAERMREELRSLRVYSCTTNRQIH